MAEPKTAERATDQAAAEVKAEAKPQRKRITRRRAVEEELRDYFKSMFAAMPDARTTVTRLVAGEQSCAVEWRLEGTLNAAPFMGIEPTGEHVEIRGFDLFELEDGDLVSNTAYFDGMGFARQIGMLPPDGSGTDRAMRNAFNAVTKLRRALAERRGG